MNGHRHESTVTKDVSVVVDQSAHVDVDIDVTADDGVAMELAQRLEDAVVGVCEDYCDGEPNLMFYR